MTFSQTAPSPPAALDAEGPVLLREDIDSVAILTLNRPQSRNTLSEAALDALTAAWNDIAKDRRVRAVVLAAKGPAFCAGHDLKQLTARRTDADRGRAYFAQMMTRCSTMMQQIVALPQPVIAAVQGVASAAGCQIVAACDLAIAESGARFVTPGVNIGLFCSTPMVALSRNVSRKHAMQMLLTGDLVTAAEALRMGLVNRVVKPGAARDAALELAQTIAGKSASTVKIGKQAFYRQAEMGLADAYRYVSEVMTENLLARDAEEGIGAFIDKRPPRWSD